MPRVYLAFSAAGQGKTSFALSGKGTSWYGETDPGSFERAISGLDVPRSNIDYHAFHAPIDDVWGEFGTLDTSMVGKEDKGPVQVVHKLEGWFDVWKDWRLQYGKGLQGDFNTMIVDTEAILWDIHQSSMEERFQKELGKRDAQIKRLEYRDLNAQMTQIVVGAKSKGKDLVFVSHETEIWEDQKPTGRFKPEGWKKAENEADATLRFQVRNKKPYCTIYKAGGCDLALIGLGIAEPTLAKVNMILTIATMLRSEKKKLPDPLTVESLLNRGKLMDIEGIEEFVD